MKCGWWKTLLKKPTPVFTPPPSVIYGLPPYTVCRATEEPTYARVLNIGGNLCGFIGAGYLVHGTVKKEHEQVMGKLDKVMEKFDKGMEEVMGKFDKVMGKFDKGMEELEKLKKLCKKSDVAAAGKSKSDVAAAGKPVKE